MQPKSSQNGTNSLDIETDLVDGQSLRKGEVSMDFETYGTKCSDRSQAKKSNIEKLTSNSVGTKMHKSAKSTVKMPRDQTCSERGNMDQIPNVSGTFCKNSTPIFQCEILVKFMLKFSLQLEQKSLNWPI